RLDKSFLHGFLPSAGDPLCPKLKSLSERRGTCRLYWGKHPKILPHVAKLEGVKPSADLEAWMLSGTMHTWSKKDLITTMFIGNSQTGTDCVYWPCTWPGG
ncbi:hypothetical protein K443DRAFT_107092, partial [Laccaria amethystina LaAM-08-1]